MPRIAAWSILRSGSTTPLREVNRAAEQRGLDARDRGLVRRLVGTEVRRRGTLRALVRLFARGKPSPDLTAHLHLGIVQLLFLDRVPDHAAVSATVDATARTIGRSKVPYVNAVLRAVSKARLEGSCGDPQRDLPGRPLHFDRAVFRDPAEHPLLWTEDALSMPAQIMRRWVKRLGEEGARALAELALAETRLSLRVVRGGRAELLEELTALGAEPIEGAHPAILLCPPEHTELVTGSPAFAEGRVTVQGESALRAAELVLAREGERVLDLCAAPGGKTAVLAGAGARVTACDVDREKGELLKRGLERLGLAGQVEFRLSDATEALEGATFDAVLVDPPCSNTGVLAQRPGARWRFGRASLEELTHKQERLLQHAAEAVAPGGRLVWSTCSLEPEENERLVRGFLERRPAWELEEQHAFLPAAPPGPVDGGFAARLRRG